MKLNLSEQIMFGTAAVAVLGMAAGFSLNVSESAPMGLWFKTSIDKQQIERGTFVLVCPPPSPAVRAVVAMNVMPGGNCPITNLAPIGKPVRAVHGDVVSLYSARSVSINGVTLPNTISKDTIPNFPNGEYVVQPDEVWLFSNYSPNSFDSRYFGPVKINEVIGQAFPILTTEKNDD